MEANEINKSELRKIIYFLLQGKKRAELESMGITLTQKTVTGISPSKLYDTFTDLYYKLTGCTVTKLTIKPSVSYIVEKDGKRILKRKTLESSDLSKLNVPSHITLYESYDTVIIDSVDKDNNPRHEVLQNAFNPVKLYKQTTKR